MRASARACVHACGCVCVLSYQWFVFPLPLPLPLPMHGLCRWATCGWDWLFGPSAYRSAFSRSVTLTLTPLTPNLILGLPPSLYLTLSLDTTYPRATAPFAPRAYFKVMLVKSLPYIFPNLVLPFSTRGLPLKTESLYTEERWAPDGYSDFEQTPEMKRYFISSAPAPTSGPETEKGTDKGTATARTATKQVRLTTEGETTSVAKR